MRTATLLQQENSMRFRDESYSLCCFGGPGSYLAWSKVRKIVLKINDESLQVNRQLHRREKKKTKKKVKVKKKTHTFIIHFYLLADHTTITIVVYKGLGASNGRCPHHFHTRALRVEISCHCARSIGHFRSTITKLLILFGNTYGEYRRK